VITRAGRRGRLTPLAALVALGALLASLGGLLAAALILDHRIGVPVWQVVVAGSPVSLVTAGLCAFAAGRFARQLRILRAEAAHRVTEPAGDVGERRLVVPSWVGAELHELARALDGITLRVRLADEVAERHRRLAETSSAGMFELLSGLVAAEEGARGQLAAELHDTVAQSLMTARALLADGVPDDRRLALVADLIGEAEEQVRAVMARTRPPALREGDLARAVAGLRDDLRGRYGVEVAVHWPSEAYPLPLATAVTVYRFFQEALLNVVKHADVDAATVALDVDAKWVVATVADAGPGFDPSHVRSEGGRHVGLGLLRDRARLLGGALDVDSWPSKGTTVTLRLPRGAGAAPGLLPRPRLAAVS
jgi:signal transduction histidine kinase